MSNYVQANNNEGRRITPTNDDDGYNNNNNNNNNNTQNINIKSRKKSSNKTNLRNLKKNEKFFKKFQQEIESSIHSTSSSVIANYNNNILDNNQPILLKSTSTTVIPPIISKNTNNSNNKKEKKLIFNLADVSNNDSDLFDKSFRKTSHQMNAIKTKPNNNNNNLKRISAIPIKTKNEIVKNQQQFPPVLASMNEEHVQKQQQQQRSEQLSLLNKSEQMSINDPSTVSLEDFSSNKSKNDEFIDMDLKPVFSRSLKNKIKNHYKSINSESLFNSIDSNNEQQINNNNNNNSEHNTNNNNGNVVPDLINDKFFKNKSTNQNKPQLHQQQQLNNKGRHSKSNSFESSSFLMPIENGFSSNKKQQITTKLNQSKNYRLK